MNRKGIAGDIALYIVLLFVIAISIPAAYFLYVQMEAAMNTIDTLPAAQTTQMNDIKLRYENVFDGVFLTLLIGVIISLLGASFLLRSNAVVFFIMLLVVTILAGLSGYLANAFSQVTTDSVLSMDKFPITDFVMSNYLGFVVVMIFLMLVVFFAKPSGGQL